MVYCKKTFMTKVTALLLSILMLTSLVPVGVIALASTSVEFGELSCVTENGVLTNATGSDATAAFTGLTLNWSAAEPSVGRTQDGWWVGVKMTAPKDMKTEENFEGVTYQSQGSSGDWSEGKSFWKNQDSDPNVDGVERYITLWGFVNEEKLNEAILTGNDITYKWQFDWDKDSAYEQTATLKIDPDNVVLLKGEDEENNKVYPAQSGAIGTVSMFGDGFNVENGNSNFATVTCGDDVVTLDWVAQYQDDVKRPCDGWWIGCKIIAPSDISEDESVLANAKFQTKSGSSGTWSGGKFIEHRDSAEDAEEQYIGLWSLVNPEILTNAKETVDYYFRFDWDGNDVYEQLIHLIIDPKKMKLMSKDQVQQYPVLGKVSSSCGGAQKESEGKIVISNDNDEATMNLTAAAADGEIGRGKDGWWAGVRVEKPEWADAGKAKFQVMVDGGYPYPPEDPGNFFSTYADDKENPTCISLWAFLGGDVGTITAKGNIVKGWRFDWDGNGNYEQVIELRIDTTRNLELYTIDQSKPFVFDTPEPFIIGTSDESKLSYTNPAQGGSGAGEVTYAIAPDDSDADISETGVVTFDKDTTGKFTVTATKAADGIYNAAGPISYDLYLAKSEYTVTYGANDNVFSNPIAAYAAHFEGIQYTTTPPTPQSASEEPAASADPTTGEVTIHRAGSVKIQAEWEGQTFEYTLTVEKADVELVKEMSDSEYGKYTAKVRATYDKIAGNSTNLASDLVENTLGEKYGITALEHTLTLPKNADETTEFTVTVGEANGLSGATVDGKKIKFADCEIGSVTVTIHRDEDSRYHAIDFTYILKIEYAEGFSEFDDAWLSGEKKNDSGWYTSNVEITPPEGYQISKSDILSRDNWKDSVTIDTEGENETKVYLRDRNGYISQEIDCGTFKIDKTNPDGLSIEYEGKDDPNLFQVIGKYLFGIGTNKDSVKVTISANDAMPGSGIDCFSIAVECDGTEGATKVELPDELVLSADGSVRSGKAGFVDNVDLESTEDGTVKLSFVVPAQFRGKLIIEEVTDVSGNTSDDYADGYTDGNILVVDNMSPKINVTYSYPDETGIQYTDGDLNTVENFASASRAFFNKTVTAKISIDEANFFEGETVDEKVVHEVGILLTKTDKDGNVTKTEYLPEGAAQKYADAGTAPVTWSHESDKHTFEIKYADDADYVLTVKYGDFSKNPAEITADDNGATETESETAETTYTSKKITVDTHKPEIKDVEYSDHINFWDVIANAITFGYYTYNPFVTVTVTAVDELSGIDHFVLTYTKEDGVSSAKDVGERTITIPNEEEKIDYSDGGKKAEATFTLTAEEAKQYRGHISVKAYDRSTNYAERSDDTRINIVDTLSPKIDVTYSSDGANVRYTDENLGDENDFASATRAFFNKNVKATISIDEANFFEGVTAKNGKINGNEVEDYVIHEVGILLTKTDKDGNVTKTEYLPERAAQKYAGAGTAPVTWLHEGDKHTFEIEYADDGDYVLTVEYTDLSDNEAEITAGDITVDDSMEPVVKTYVSKPVTVDKTDPVISVSYADQNKYVQEIDGREYYNANRTATIKIKEHNFRADDVIVNVYAKNVVGENISPIGTLTFGENGIVNEYFNDGKDRKKWSAYDEGSWRRDDDTFELVLEYTEDANYTFDIKYTDLAGNEFVAPTDYFTIDKTNPDHLAVTYDGDVKTTILDKVLNVITFGYYNAKVTVTVSADDDVSGIDHFDYSYIKADGVSSVNASLENETIKKVTQNGKNFSGTFEIPKEALQNTNQFNGSVHFTAYDRAGNSLQHKETAVIVVDNIAPTATITFNDPVQKVNDVSYYAGDINATIVVNEANFYSQDVQVVVTKDDVNYPVKVTWTDNSVDVHTGTFALTEDGDYKVTVTYTDRSKNEMTPYESNQLTIDTKNPVISVSNVKHQSANNQETIGFTISVTDINIPIENFKPVLNAVVKKDNGNNNFSYETKSIALGNAVTTVNANGETVHSYTVNNLEADGYYSLSCTAVDYANHSVSGINAATDAGGNAAVETMNFSVNREGSVFWIETEHNDKYTNETFTDKLDGAYANDNVVIKLHEVNVDKVDENADRRTVFTLNDGSKSEDIVLQENENYSKNVSVGAGGWYETTYTLNNDTFDHDGVYSLNVITYDKAGNSNVNTKTDAGTISFTLDRTNPVISANVRTNQSIRDTQFWVEFEVTETNLDAETIAVKLINNDGEAVETNIENLGDNGYRFLVESGYNYSFEIAAKDLAGNESEVYKVEHFTVSTNIFILWYANAPLFWGSIGGVILLAGMITLLVFLKKRKKNEEK